MSSDKAQEQGWGKIGLRGRGVAGAPFPDPPPLLGSRDGALKKVIDGGNKVELPLKGGGGRGGAVVVFMSGQTETHSLGFLSVADSPSTSMEDRPSQNKQWPNGNAADRRLFCRRFEPWLGEHGGGAADDK